MKITLSRGNRGLRDGLIAIPQDESLVMKITDHKLTGLNYVDWSKTVKIYLHIIRKSRHLFDVSNTTVDDWMEDDARLFTQIKNSVVTSIISTVQHCNTNKCIISSSSKWVIDFGATDHMTGSLDETDYW
ncbi:uncharacterized protein [Euphorbia lathyris]|uniref:uncharacterized protein n=1 Tax=Euphorbia lathyris TaxID=212925 RepID=UPI00331313E3